MNGRTKVLAAALAGAFSVWAPSAVACDTCGCTMAAAPELTKNIVETASEAGAFNTLLAAAQAAGLAETLSGPGPFTVLAPTDEAFAALPPGTVESLLLPENKETLKAVLLYHVVSGKVMSGTVATLDTAETLNGASVDIEASDSGITVNGASVIQADVEATNGVIHVIDAVLLPPSDA